MSLYWCVMSLIFSMSLDYRRAEEKKGFAIARENGANVERWFEVWQMSDRMQYEVQRTNATRFNVIDFV